MLHADFLPFDARAGDETIPPARAQTTLQSTLNLSTPMVVYGQKYEEIQVSSACPEVHIIIIIIVQLYTGGYMVFGEALSSSMCLFNPSASSTPTIFLVSALTNNCINSAVLHYRVISQKQQQEKDKETLAQVAAKISDSNSNLIAFQPSMAVIATWNLGNVSNRCVFYV